MNFHSTDEFCRFRSFAEAERGGESSMSGEEWVARLYCQPKAFWRCARQLNGSRYYTFDEINRPESWLKAVEKYTEEMPSTALRQLHRRVEAARVEFRLKQDKAWGNRNVGTTTPAPYEKLESTAWAIFNKQKQDYLQEYLKAIESGKPIRRRLTHKCKQCGEPGVRLRFRFCVPCGKSRKRESNRRSKSRLSGGNGSEGDMA
jgi:hypothetical protein